MPSFDDVTRLLRRAEAVRYQALVSRDHLLQTMMENMAKVHTSSPKQYWCSFIPLPLVSHLVLLRDRITSARSPSPSQGSPILIGVPNHLKSIDDFLEHRSVVRF